MLMMFDHTAPESSQLSLCVQVAPGLPIASGYKPVSPEVMNGNATPSGECAFEFSVPQNWWSQCRGQLYRKNLLIGGAD